MRLFTLALMLILAAAPAALDAAPGRKAAAVRDWSRAVVATPEGGFRMGNPNAAVKLVEYGSMTCPHCAHFAVEGFAPLVSKYVRTGKVSFEFRNFVRDPYDLAAALLAQCAGAPRFFPLTEQLFATQRGWTGRFGSLSAGEYEALQAMPQTPRLLRIASLGGLDSLAAKHGVTAAKARACLSDAKRVDALMETRRVAVTQHDLEGTPTFLINGRKVDANSWAAIEPQLRPPGR